MDLRSTVIIAVIALAGAAIWYGMSGRYQDVPSIGLDEMMLEASEAFASHHLDIPDFDVAFAGANFDYSVESLRFVDEGLERLRSKLKQNEDGTRDLSDAENSGLMRLTSGAGAYLGEVMRRNSEHAFEWRAFEELPDEAKNVFGGEKDMSNFVVLKRTGDNGEFVLPMNRIGRFLINGNEDSLLAFAKANLAKH